VAALSGLDFDVSSLDVALFFPRVSSSFEDVFPDVFFVDAPEGGAVEVPIASSPTSVPEFDCAEEDDPSCLFETPERTFFAVEPPRFALESSAVLGSVLSLTSDDLVDALSWFATEFDVVFDVPETVDLIDGNADEEDDVFVPSGLDVVPDDVFLLVSASFVEDVPPPTLRLE
jgi:hypothetical protein